MTQELCKEMIVLEAAAMLHGTDAEFAIIESVHEAKSSASIEYFFKNLPRYWYFGIGTILKKYHGILVNGTSHICLYPIKIKQNLTLLK